MSIINLLNLWRGEERHLDLIDSIEELRFGKVVKFKANSVETA